METAHSLLPVSAASRPPAVGACDRPCRSRTLKAPPLCSPAQRMTTIKSDQNSARKTRPVQPAGTALNLAPPLRGTANPLIPAATNVLFPARDSCGANPVVWGERCLASRKSPELPRRNAKTRWGEPAGPERCGHVAVTTLMEAGGIEPPSCCS